MSTNEAWNERPSEGSSATLFLPRLETSERTGSRAGWSLSPELRQQITRRLRLIAITYSLAFFFADVVPTALFHQLGEWFRHPFLWITGVGSILAGLLVAGISSSPRLSWQNKLNLGLAFEVLGSYGIALAQYTFPPDIRNEPHILHVLSPSWVAIWMLFYSIVVPAPPRKTLVALIASASAPPVVIWFSLHAAGLGDLMPLPMFLVHHVLPYVICVAMAYAGARVVYNLGADVVRARELGSYRLIERLGRGGMGEVWRASHRLLARPAAIKFISPEAIAGANPSEARTMLKRFEREARSTASLTSAHTVDLYDFGETDGGSFYYVMELLDGLDCDELVRRFGAIPPARVVHLLGQICESLDEAHTKGLIHRDVKPANIYVCRAGNRFDFVKVLDFGLVADRGAPDAMDTRLTLPNHVVGTPQFMPPEVALGRETDGRTDLYALGCVAYWLATGRSVFTGESLYEVVSKHVHAIPDPPSRHAPHELPPELDALVLACLEKEPDRRPPTARELARRLRSVPLADRWGDEQAEAWWEEVGLSHRDASSPSTSSP
jgi:serine/threonine-protein kinase